MTLPATSSELQLPAFEKSAAEVLESVKKLLKISQAALDKIGSLPATELTFANTVGALDDLSFENSLVMSRIYLLQNVSEDEELRKAAQEASIEFQNWGVEALYNEKVYQSVKAYAAKGEALSGERKKLLEEKLRDYKRLGLELPTEKKTRLKELQKKLSEIETEFQSEIHEYQDQVAFSHEELEGLDEKFLEGLKKDADGKYIVTLQYPDYLPVMEFCKREETRRTLLIRKNQTAKDKNCQTLDQMISLRDDIAKLLGYNSWNDYSIEEKMAKKPEAVFSFLNDFEAKLRPKAEAEVKVLEKLKREETGDKNASLNLWDFSHYSSLNKKRKYQIDSNILKELFPLQKVFNGLFALVEELFQVRIEEQPAGTFYSWNKDVKLFKISEAKRGEALGFFYMDLYPRPGKYGHAAAFTLIEGKLRADGIYQRPVSAMVCNFPQQGPSFLPHAEVETLFHEFGHILHNLLTRAHFVEFSGTNVAWDFVEVPSQVMEYWAWDYDILTRIAEVSDKIKLTPELVNLMTEAKRAGSGLFYLRQLSFAYTDLEFHKEGREKDSTKIMKEISKRFFLPYPENTFPNASFGHMVGYASGYYGYAWADVMAADIFSLFKKQGLLNKELGLKLREDIFEPGSARDEKDSLEAFLNRPLSQAAFFEDLGVAV